MEATFRSQNCGNFDSGTALGNAWNAYRQMTMNRDFSEQRFHHADF
jgi:hypothetical protein